MKHLKVSTKVQPMLAQDDNLLNAVVKGGITTAFTGLNPFLSILLANKFNSSATS